MSSQIEKNRVAQGNKKVALEILVPTFNRPATLYRLLKTGVFFENTGIRFVVLDDGSFLKEEVLELGQVSTEEVARHFGEALVRYIRISINAGLALATSEYYQKHCLARYTMHITDKDTFLSDSPIIKAVSILDANPDVMMVQLPVCQWNGEEETPLLYDYSRMSGSQFIYHYVRDPRMQHAGISGVLRADKVIQLGVPRILGLRQKGLEDAFGMDIDILMNLVASGDVDFVSEPHLRQNIVGGITEKYPLSFAFCYYQYVKRVMNELFKKRVVSRETLNYYVRWWLLVLVRGLTVVYQSLDHLIERDENQVSRYIKKRVIVYLFLEYLRYGIFPDPQARAVIRVYFQQKYPNVVARMTRGYLFFSRVKKFFLLN